MAPKSKNQWTISAMFAWKPPNDTNVYNILFSTNIQCIYFFKSNFFDKPSFDGRKFWNIVLMTSNVSGQKATLLGTNVT